MVQTLWVPGSLPGWNQINGGKIRDKIRIKRTAQNAVRMFINAAKLKPMDRAFVRYDWRAPNKRTDPSNLAAGGRKIIEDALQEAGVLPGDGWAAIAGFSDTFAVDKMMPGVRVTMLTEEDALRAVGIKC